MVPSQDPWYVYIVECGDGSMYAGIARDVDRRVAQHNAGTGAKYTRGRSPVVLIARSGPLGRSEALMLEARVKRRRGREAKERELTGEADPSVKTSRSERPGR